MSGMAMVMMIGMIGCLVLVASCCSAGMFAYTSGSLCSLSPQLCPPASATDPAADTAGASSTTKGGSSHGCGTGKKWDSKKKKCVKGSSSSSSAGTISGFNAPQRAVNYPGDSGGDVGGYNVRLVSECATKCRAMPNCKLFAVSTFVKGNRRNCSLKDGSAYKESNKVKDANWNTYVKKGVSRIKDKPQTTAQSQDRTATCHGVGLFDTAGVDDFPTDGVYQCFTPGTYSIENKTAFDKLGAVKVPSGYKVTMYRYGDLGKTFSTDASIFDLSKKTFSGYNLFVKDNVGQILVEKI